MFNSHPLGSSPLARGLRRVLGLPPDRSGIIPARAGFTIPASLCSASRADHPRSRGVYALVSASLRRRRGSSPLARGLPISVDLDLGSLRIIPARAGFTGLRFKAGNGGKDHPRSRGVYLWDAACDAEHRGSSPLARGLPPSPHPGSGRCRDHPRSRGVYAKASSTPSSVQGSSPLARGLPASDLRLRKSLRIIPARAGFTRSRSTELYSAPDHPRSRGVYPRTRGRRSLPAGSSPLARGLHEDGYRAITAPRIIPARAGFTRRRRRGGAGRRDHPRSRGVYKAGPPYAGRALGSSPLARGLRYHP